MPLSISLSVRAQQDEAFEYAQARAGGGAPPYVYTLQAGTLPAGLSLDSGTGLISGTPTVSGTFSGLVVRVTDAASATADLDPFTLRVRGLNVELPTNGSTPIDLSALAGAASGNLATIANAGGSPLFLQLGEAAAPPVYVRPKIAPGPLWNGVGGSGYSGAAGSPGAIPADAARTLGKPIAHLFNHDREAFIDDYTLYVHAVAFGGVEKVRFHVEGETLDVQTMARHTLTGFDGEDYPVWAYACDLDYSAFASDGWITVYAEVFPTNTALQPRLLGPYTFKRRTGSLWDHVVQFGPSLPTVAGVSYPNLRAALQYVGDQNPNTWCHVKLSTNESHQYDLAIEGTPQFYFTTGSAFPSGRPGIIDIMPEPGVTWEMIRTGVVTNNPAAVRPGLEGLRWRKGCKFDVLNMSWNSELGNHKQMSLAGCEVYSSGGAMKDMYGDTGTIKSGSPFNNFKSYEILWRDQGGGPDGGWSHRFLRCDNVCGDIYKRGTNFIDYYAYGARVTGQDSLRLRTVNDQLRVTYTGASASASISVTGGLNTNARRLELKENGVLLESVAISTTYKTGNYYLQDLANYINTTHGAGGWAATVMDNTYRAAAIGGVTTITNVNVKNVVAQIPSGFDIHADGFQWGNAAGENLLLANNAFFDGSRGVQVLFLDNSVGTAMRDIAVFNNVSDEGRLGSPPLSQMSGSQDHVIVDHNTLTHQGFLPNAQNNGNRWTPNGLCRIGANLFSSLSIASGIPTQTDVATISYNHTLGGSAIPSGSGVSNNTTGGSAATLFPDVAVGDFAPADLAHANLPLVPALISYDLNGDPRASLTTSGGVENRAYVPAGESIVLPVEWLRACGLNVVTVGATPTDGVDSLTISVREGVGETGALIEEQPLFDIVA